MLNEDYRDMSHALCGEKAKFLLAKISGSSFTAKTHNLITPIMEDYTG